MEERCTCGAVLPLDARFCHKCGRPLFQEDVDRLATLEAESNPVRPPVITAAVEPAATPLSTIRAIGITLAAAAVALVCLTVVGIVVPLAMPVIICAAGFGAARLYSSKRTITTLTGALLGTMTGGWLFLISAFSTFILSTSLARPELHAAVMKSFPPEVADEAVRILNDPHQLVSRILIPMFFTLVIFPTFGGLLAVVLRRSKQPKAL